MPYNLLANSQVFHPELVGGLQVRVTESICISMGADGSYGRWIVVFHDQWFIALLTLALERPS